MDTLRQKIQEAVDKCEAHPPWAIMEALLTLLEDLKAILKEDKHD